jgi:signal transduction histidine kinase
MASGGLEGLSRDSAAAETELHIPKLTAADLPAADRRVLRLARIFAWLVCGVTVGFAVLGDWLLMLLVPEPGTQFTVRAIGLAATAAAATLVASQVNLPMLAETMLAKEAARRAYERAAKLEGALLAARTVEHHLNNDLAITVGYSELLALNPELAEPARSQAEEVHRGAQRAVDHLQALLTVTDVDEDRSLGTSLLQLAEPAKRSPRSQV